MISAQHICFGYGKENLLDDICLEIKPGTVAALMGPNGAGKTSLLKLMSGELKSRSGEIRFNQRAIDDWPAIEKAQMMAVLAQDNLLDFNFTVEEVVTLARIPHHSGDKADKKIVQAALALVDASHLAHRIYPLLSGGEKQRVNLARVLAQIWCESALGPRLLMLDEPSASFDLAHQQLLKKIIRQIAADQVTILMVLHDLNLAAQSVDHIFFLDQGRIVADGPPLQVLRKDIIASVFSIEADIIQHPKTGLPVVIP